VTEPQFTHQDVDVISDEIVYRGFYKVHQFQLRFPLFQGGKSEIALREMVERKAAVGVLPYDPVRQQVVLIEQFRVGALGVGQSPWILEIVAGLIDENESLETVAHREAQEEAGLVLLDLKPIYHYLTSPGGSSEHLHLYCATVDATQAKAYCGLAEEQEDIKVHVLDYDYVMELLDHGKIMNAATIIALQWLRINRERIAT
jgi:ADP-ribose pyrophosphatase